MIDYKKLAAQAAEMEDQTETKAGGDFEYTPPVAGKTFGRFIEYIEMGKQKQRPYQGKPKPDADNVRVTFELLHPKKNIREIEVDGKKVKVTDRISLTMPKSLSEKSKYVKLFKKMARGRDDIKHMAQMLNEAFLIDVVHNTVEKDGKKTTYANIQGEDGAFLISAPQAENLETGEVTQIPVPAALSPIRIFLWSQPSKETWDTLFIDGTREVKDGDKVTQVSKNWLQNQILSASNFTGSPLEDMLSGSAELLANIGEEEPEAAPAKTPAQKEAAKSPAKKSVATEAPAKKAASASTKTTSAPVAKAKAAAPKKAAAEVEDPLAALGL